MKMKINIFTTCITPRYSPKRCHYYMNLDDDEERLITRSTATCQKGWVWIYELWIIKTTHFDAL